MRSFHKINEKYEKQNSQNPLNGFKIFSDSIAELNDNLSAEITNKSSIQGF